jgi:hypothetical protein
MLVAVIRISNSRLRLFLRSEQALDGVATPVGLASEATLHGVADALDG